MGTRYEFEEVRDDKLIVSIRLDTCKNCGRKMTSCYQDLALSLLKQLKEHNIVRETYDEPNLCGECLREGTFSRSCDLCRENRTFPQQFSFEVRFWAKYPDDETRTEYVCNNCYETHPQSVIEMIIKADETKDIRSKL